MSFQPLFRLGNVPTIANGGVRSLLAFWIGGACSPATAPITPPAPSPPPPISGGVGGGRRRRPEYRNAFALIKRKQIEDLEELKRQISAKVEQAPEPIEARSAVLETLADISRKIQEIEDEIDDEEVVEYLLLH